MYEIDLSSAIELDWLQATDDLCILYSDQNKKWQLKLTMYNSLLVTEWTKEF